MQFSAAKKRIVWEISTCAKMCKDSNRELLGRCGVRWYFKNSHLSSWGCVRPQTSRETKRHCLQRVIGHSYDWAQSGNVSVANGTILLSQVPPKRINHFSEHSLATPSARNRLYASHWEIIIEDATVATLELLEFELCTRAGTASASRSVEVVLQQC